MAQGQPTEALGVGTPIPSMSCSQALWEHIVLPGPHGGTLGVPCAPRALKRHSGCALCPPALWGHSRATQCPPIPCWGAPCTLALCCPGCPHSPAPLHVWDGDTDGSPCTPQEGSDTCTLLWAGVTEPPVIYFYTLYYNSCFYSFVPFVLCLVVLHVPALPTAAQGPPGAA